MTAPAFDLLSGDREAGAGSAEGSTGLLARQLLRAVSEAPAADLPCLVAVCAQAQALGLARLATPAAAAGEAPEAVRYIGLEDAQKLTGQTRRWLLRHTRGLRFRRDLSRKAVRFEEGGLLRWLRGRA